MKTSIITLLTDFGTKDGYVGAMKGVILNISPDTTIIDITHEIRSQDILEGAFIFKSAYIYYPENTIHIGVVDPGVGSSRKPILIDTGKYKFVGPDNGLFTFILKENPKCKIFELTNSKYFLKEVSSTFHGRDIFSPVAAYLAKGVNPSKLGKRISQVEMLPIPEVVFLSENQLKGFVLYIDKFGNIITNIDSKLLKKNSCQILIKGKQISKISNYYNEVNEGELIALWGSSHFLEISINRGDASKELGVKVGDSFQITWSS